jgi:ATP-dependent Zn protease
MTEYNHELIYGMIIATSISSLLGYLTNNIPNIFKNIIYYVRRVYFYFFEIKENEVNIVGTIYKNNYGIKKSFSPEYNAVMSMLVKKKLNLNNITYIDNNEADPWNKEQHETFDFKKYQFYVNSNIKIKMNDNVYVRFYDHEEERGKDNSYITKYLTIIISSTQYTTSELQEKIANWTRDYENENKLYKDDGKIYHYSINSNSEKKEDILCEDNEQKKNEEKKYNTGLKWSKNILTTFKTFDNIFFKDKEILMKKLNYFLNNEDKYKKKGIPYNIGFLFYGDPGCGKTSCIKAISNYTKRHVVEINLKLIETCGDFIEIFTNNIMNDDYIPHDKKIIILEDIDCMIDIVKSRDTKKENELVEKTTDIENIFNLLLDKNKNKFNKNDKLTLSCILNTIDGVLENYGRILIITTNYAEQLDKALIRPGRIDMKINFTKTTNQMYYDIIENFFEQKISKRLIFPEQKYTPAEVLEICALHQDNVNDAINYLQNKRD